MKLSAPVFRLKRKAKQLARQSNLPLHAALDRVAAKEGYRGWGHLSASYRDNCLKTGIIEKLEQGELLLIAARPGQGKTIFGISLLVEAIRAGHKSVFFSSECTPESVRQRLIDRDAGELIGSAEMQIDLSDHLCADLIVTRLADAEPGTVAVIDYLQVLDQDRRVPELNYQLAQLKRFSRKKGIRLAFLSQVHRSFDPDQRQVPDFPDVRSPNPIDLSVFDRGCFLHGGELKVRSNQS